MPKTRKKKFKNLSKKSQRKRYQFQSRKNKNKQFQRKSYHSRTKKKKNNHKVLGGCPTEPNLSAPHPRTSIQVSENLTPDNNPHFKFLKFFSTHNTFIEGSGPLGNGPRKWKYVLENLDLLNRMPVCIEIDISNSSSASKIVVGHNIGTLGDKTVKKEVSQENPTGVRNPNTSSGKLSKVLGKLNLVNKGEHHFEIENVFEIIKNYVFPAVSEGNKYPLVLNIDVSQIGTRSIKNAVFELFFKVFGPDTVGKGVKVLEKTLSESMNKVFLRCSSDDHTHIPKKEGGKKLTHKSLNNIGDDFLNNQENITRVYPRNRHPGDSQQIVLAHYYPEYRDVNMLAFNYHQIGETEIKTLKEKFQALYQTITVTNRAVLAAATARPATERHNIPRALAKRPVTLSASLPPPG